MPFLPTESPRLSTWTMANSIGATDFRRLVPGLASSFCMRNHTTRKEKIKLRLLTAGWILFWQRLLCSSLPVWKNSTTALLYGCRRSTIKIHMLVFRVFLLRLPILQISVLFPSRKLRPAVRLSCIRKPVGRQSRLYQL